VAKSQIFRDDFDRAAFREQLIRTGQRYALRYDAWCLMTTHFHLVAAASRPALSAAMHRLNGLYAQRFNLRYERRGHLFENRFSAWVLDTEEHWENACRYVLNNPVEAGLCARAEQWPWSGGLFRAVR
jgi:REP element-mobilizing transposase RayT